MIGNGPDLPGDEAAAIVRSLAACNDEEGEYFSVRVAGRGCVLCGGFVARDDHESTCPWKLARAWVAAHDMPMPADFVRVSPAPRAEPPEVEPPAR